MKYLKDVEGMTLVDIAKKVDPVLALDNFYKWNETVPNNSPTPWMKPLPPLGTWRLDPVTREFEVCILVRAADVTPAELEDGIKQRCQFYPLYAEWARQGMAAPPITVFPNTSRQLRSIGRRRTLAAQEAGVEFIRAWFSETTDSGSFAWQLSPDDMAGIMTLWRRNRQKKKEAA